MGQIQILTAKQKKILSLVNESEYLLNSFYFTGGTALSVYHLQHRFSDDIDLFTEQPLDLNILEPLVLSWAKKMHATVTPNLVENILYLCMFTFEGGEQLKVDLCQYPYPRLEHGLKDGKLTIDSLFDIATNKMTTISRRATAKDFVDLYYLYPKFGFWDLSYSVENKFKMKLDKFLVSSDLLIAQEFTELPRMIKPLTLKELKLFYKNLALELAKDSVVA